MSSVVIGPLGSVLGRVGCLEVHGSPKASEQSPFTIERGHWREVRTSAAGHTLGLEVAFWTQSANLLGPSVPDPGFVNFEVNADGVL